ncbi:MAG: NAD(P)H-dependent oxidoreductase [Polyangiales bacterium]
MHAVIVVSHPEPGSLSHQLAREVGRGLREHGHDHELADLSAEGFEPRFSAADLAVHRQQATPPLDVLREQARLDRADALVLVYPVYWWSMPGLLKGWIDRVFANGWAFDYREQKLVKKLRHLRVHLLGLAGADDGTYDRHRYRDAMQVQLEHGIFDYCGATVGHSLLLTDSESQPPAAHLARARALGADLFTRLEVARSP